MMMLKTTKSLLDLEQPFRFIEFQFLDLQKDNKYLMLGMRCRNNICKENGTGPKI